MGSNLPNHTAFSEEAGKINEKVLGEGSFVIVKLGIFKTLGVNCVVKKQKTPSRNYLML